MCIEKGNNKETNMHIKGNKKIIYFLLLLCKKYILVFWSLILYLMIHDKFRITIQKIGFPIRNWFPNLITMLLIPTIH